MSFFCTDWKGRFYADDVASLDIQLSLKLFVKFYFSTQNQFVTHKKDQNYISDLQ